MTGAPVSATLLYSFSWSASGGRVRTFQPKSGDVVGFSYLWSWEAEAGHDRGLKRRPCLIVQVEAQADGARVRLVPISHRPITKMPSIEIPKGYLREAGLDGLGCYVIPGEVNTAPWPSAARDFELLPKGRLPGGFLSTVQGVLLKQHEAGKLVEVDRGRLARDIVERYRAREWERDGR